MSRFVKGDTVRLQISRGDWLLVKKELNAGEERDMFALTATARTFKHGDRIELRIDRLGLATLVQYLVDWSLTDDDGKPVVIRGADPELVMETLNNLDVDSFREIQAAITAHQETIDLEKKLQVTGSES
jgi:hypothetical protein